MAATSTLTVAVSDTTPECESHEKCDPSHPLCFVASSGAADAPTIHAVDGIVGEVDAAEGAIAAVRVPTDALRQASTRKQEQKYMDAALSLTAEASRKFRSRRSQRSSRCGAGPWK